MNRWLRLTRFDRPIGILLLLWPTCWALLIAGDGWPSLKNTGIFLIGVVVMRAAGCVINDYADRHFDPHVERTRQRPIAAGEIHPAHALWFFIGLLLLAFILIVQTNGFATKLAFVGAALATIYPFCKRVTHLPQLVLGMAFGWSIPMVFAAETNTLPTITWWLFTINVIWSVIYDTQYAMADRDDDITIGVKSTAILFNRFDRHIIGLLQICMLFLLIRISFMLPAPQWPLWLATVITGGLFLQHQQLICSRQPAQCFKAFQQNNRVGLVIFSGLLATYWL